MANRPPSTGPRRRPWVPRGRPAIAPPPAVGRATADIVSRFTKTFGAGVGDLAARWEDIVGAKTARMCAPVKLTGRGASGTLHLAAAGPAALLVEAESGRILERVNTYFGRDVARRIAITRTAARRPSAAPEAPSKTPGTRAGLAPTKRAKLEEDLASIDDPRLKAALRKLGQEALRPLGPSRSGGPTPTKKD